MHELRRPSMDDVEIVVMLTLEGSGGRGHKGLKSRSAETPRDDDPTCRKGRESQAQRVSNLV